MRKSDAVASSLFFDSLPQEQSAALLKISSRQQFAKGEMIFFEGDLAHGFFIVLSGTVKIFKVSASGKEQILHIFGKGETFGEVPVFHGEPYPACAQALDAVSVMFFPRQDFTHLLGENPAIALEMLAVLSKKLRGFNRQVEALSLKEVPTRLADYLLYLSEEQQSDKVVLEISKGQLASLLGTSPETLSRILAKMATEKLLTVEGRTIHLLDRERLAKY